MERQPNETILNIISWLDDQTKIFTMSVVCKNFNLLVKLSKNKCNNIEDLILNNKYLSCDDLLTENYLSWTYMNNITIGDVVYTICKYLKKNIFVKYLDKINIEPNLNFRLFHVVLWCIHKNFNNFFKILYEKLKLNFLKSENYNIIGETVCENNIEMLDYVMNDVDYSKINYDQFSNYGCDVMIDAIIRNNNIKMMQHIINKGFDVNNNKYYLIKNATNYSADSMIKFFK